MQILEGAGKTIGLFVIVLAASIPLGFVFTLITRCKIAPFRWIMNALIYIIRGTPLMLQLVFVYFGLPNLPVIGEYLAFDRFPASCFAFIINYAAYLAEIYRGGLLAVDKGQYEASKVLGLTKFQTMSRIIIPQMIRVCLPSIGNEAVTLVKDTALVCTIGLVEIMHLTKSIVSKEGDPMIFVIAAAIYLVINGVVTFVFKKIEKANDYAKVGN